jgi:tRNA(Ile)-lysidine synthase TilS/MesJ
VIAEIKGSLNVLLIIIVPIGGLKVASPLANFTMKELALYNHFRKLETIVIPTFTTMKPANLKLSINQVTQTFLETLEQDREGTGSTIVRTAAKCKYLQSQTVCPLCFQCPVDGKPDASIRGVIANHENPLNDGICWGCMTSVQELTKQDKRGGTRSITMPLFPLIQEFLIKN